MADKKHFEGWYIETLEEKEENREDSFWYRDKSIAVAQFPNGKKLYIDACGEISLQFEIDGQVYFNDKAVEKARELNLTDKDLNRMGIMFDAFGNNNWFAIHEFDINGGLIADDLGIAGDYDEAMQLLEVVGMETMKRYYS